MQCIKKNFIKEFESSCDYNLLFWNRLDFEAVFLFPK